ncbi:MAG TPA: chalcone isomerase family protein [Candidatus Sulfotelmatobacter sp.]|nr:chalcone isomerase family protein [Candidatus Sulfotelmatobacter sp.]
MRSPLAVLLLFFSVIGPALAQDLAEPKTGTKFAVKDGGTSLLGIGLRTKTIAKVKVYAIGLYVADSALAGPLKGKAGSADLYRELVNGDFEKKVVLKFVRNVSTDQIRDAFRDSLKGAGNNTEPWIANFNEVRSGQEIVIGWAPGVGLETKAAGEDKPVINGKAFASAVFAIWLGDKPIQEDVKRDLTTRAAELAR